MVDALADMLAARPQWFKAWHFSPIVLHPLPEHLPGAHPQAMFPVLLSVHDQCFQRLTMPGRSDDGVFIALVMPVATGWDGCHLAHRFAYFPLGPIFLAKSSESSPSWKKIIPCSSSL